MQSAFVRFIVPALLLTAGLCWSGVALLKLEPWVAALCGVNLTALLFYGYDKSVARFERVELRVPEMVLHVLAGIGGSLGALVGRQLLRHKTRKQPFTTIFWTIIGVQAALLAGLVYMNMQN